MKSFMFAFIALILTIIALGFTHPANAANVKVFAGDAYSFHMVEPSDESTVEKYNSKHETYGIEYRFPESGYTIGGTYFENSYYLDSFEIHIGRSVSVCDYQYVTCLAGVKAGIASNYEEIPYSVNGYIPTVGAYIDISAFKSLGVRLSLENILIATASFYVEF